VLNVPSRNEEVVERAVTGAVEVYLPQVVARSIFTAIINSSVVFEECVVSLGFVLVGSTAAF
jgi:chorismate mutase